MSRLNAMRTSARPSHLAARYVLVGGTVAAVYLGLGLLLSGPVGINIQVSIPLAYLVALGVHFSLQRWVVWAHHEQYALASQVQLGRYLGISFVQYVITAAATAVLPGPLGLPARLVYVATVLTMAVVTFVSLRLLVFQEA